MKNLVPQFIMEHYKRDVFSGQFEAASLFVDLSGFTRLTETLLQFGMEGAEILADTLMDIFEPLVSAVYENGGFITGFAGDSFIAVFPIDDLFDEPGTALHRCLYTAQIISQTMAEHPIRKTRQGEFMFAVKLGLARGGVEWQILRSIEKPYQYSYFFKGPAIDQCTYAESKARHNEIILTNEVASQCAEFTQIIPYTSGYCRLRDMDLPPLASAPAPAPTWNFTADDLLVFLPAEIVHPPSKGDFRWIVTVFISLPEVTNSDLQAFVEIIFRLNRSYQGYLSQVDFGDKGCNLLLFWGVPIYYENNVERALNFLLELQSASLQVFRAGVTWQKMFTGTVGTRYHTEFSCYGRGVNLAARMMMRAGWGEIWLDENTQRVGLNHFHLELVGKLAFKGFSEARPVYKLLEKLQKQDSIYYRGQMVGRSAELERLRQFIQPILATDPPRMAGIAYVYGDAGMGKSRLVYEFQEEFCRQHSVWWLYCATDEILRHSLNPFKYMLAQFFAQSVRLSKMENEKRFVNGYDQIRRVLLMRHSEHPDFSDIVAEFRRIQPVLATMIGHLDPESFFEKLSPQLRFENTLSAFKTFIKVLSFIRPVVLFLDDIQWFDFDSHLLISHLTENLSTYPVAILCTSRYLDDHSLVSFAVDADVPTEVIELDYLTPKEIGQIAERALNGPIHTDVPRYLYEKTQGNPFFSEQMILHLNEAGGFVRQETAEGHWVYVLQAPELGDVPSTIHSVLMSRLDRLPKSVKNVVQTAAVLGWEFKTPVLEHMLNKDPELAPKMRTAARAAIWTAKSDIVYIFKHALMRDAAYDMQLPSRLLNLHNLAATALETEFADNLTPHLADLAYHYEKAEKDEKALEYLQKAARFARSNFQNQEALNIYERRLRILEKYIDPAAPLRPAQNTTPPDVSYLQEYIQTLLDQGLIHYRTASDEVSLRIHQQAIDLAEKAGEWQLLGKALRIYGLTLEERGEYDEAMAYQQRCLACFEKIGDQSGIALAMGSIGLVYASQAKYQQAAHYHECAYRMFQELDDRHYMGKSLGNLGTAYLRLGELDRARECFEQSIVYSNESDDPEEASSSLGNLGSVYMEQSNYEEAMKCFTRRLNQCREFGDRRAYAGILGNIGIIYLHTGQLSQAMNCYQQRLKMAEELKDKVGLILGYGNIGLVHEMKGEFDQSLVCAQKMFDYSDQIGNRAMMAVALGNMGGIYLLKKQYTLALDYFDRAIELGRETGIKFYLAGFLLNKANALLDLKRYAESRQANEEGLSLAEEIGKRERILQGLLTAADLDCVDEKKGVALRQAQDKVWTRLHEMLNEFDVDNMQASIHYTIYKLFKNDPEHAAEAETSRHVSITIYQRLYQETPIYEYKEHLAELRTTTNRGD